MIVDKKIANIVLIIYKMLNVSSFCLDKLKTKNIFAYYRVRYNYITEKPVPTSSYPFFTEAQINLAIFERLSIHPPTRPAYLHHVCTCVHLYINHMCPTSILKKKKNSSNAGKVNKLPTMLTAILFVR